jgi:DNA-binding NarL/FixJ family response regulator
MSKIHVLVAEAHPVTQAGIYTFLEKTPDLKPVAKTAAGQEVLELARKYQPDIILLDLKIPGPSPIKLVTKLHQQYPNIKVLALSADCADTNFRELADAGLSGIVNEAEPPEKIVEAIRAAAQGGVWFSQVAVKRLLEKAPAAESKDALDLTDRELTLLRMVVEGETNLGIALALEISEKTVEKHLAALKNKLGVNSRVQMAVWAVRNELA